MKVQFAMTFTKYVSFFVLFLAVVVLSGITIGAQTKSGKRFDRDFSVPCSEALRIGLSGLEKLHFKDTKRRNGGESDSDTEIVSDQSAMKNYLDCRRADTTKKLKKLSADERKTINTIAADVLRLARMRVDLLYGVSFDEKADDPINLAISQNAISLVEDYKGVLADIYTETKTSNALGNETAAERDRKEIAALLARIGKVSREQDEATEFAMFKTAIEKTLREIKDDVLAEKVAMTGFLVRLLKMNLANEN